MENKIPEKEYKNILEKMPIPCVDLVIENKGKVLVVFRNRNPDKGTWSVVGGRVCKGEKLADAAIRKAYEETGLKVKIERKIGGYETFFKDGPFEDIKTGVHTINSCFVASLIEPSEQVKVDETISDYKWISCIEKDLNSYSKKVIKDSEVFEK